MLQDAAGRGRTRLDMDGRGRGRTMLVLVAEGNWGGGRDTFPMITREEQRLEQRPEQRLELRQRDFDYICLRYTHTHTHWCLAILAPTTATSLYLR
jgi:hypothetical protein